MRTIKEHIYYPNYQNGGKELQFPNDPKSYLETSCDEWESTTIEDKLLDLGYLVSHGFDLQKNAGMGLFCISRTKTNERSIFQCIQNADR